MPLRRFSDRSFAAGMAITFIYMGTQLGVRLASRLSVRATLASAGMISGFIVALTLPRKAA